MTSLLRRWVAVSSSLPAVDRVLAASVLVEAVKAGVR